MKAIRIHTYGHVDQLKFEEVPQPEIKPDEVLVRVQDAGVNPVDWKIREGYLNEVMPANFPLTMGQDFAGEILKVGDAVKRFSKGVRVFGFASGSYAEVAVASENKIAKIPDSISYEIAASLPTAGVTAYQIVVKVAQAKPGKIILIHGAAGGVGSVATQIAVHKGATVFGTASEKDIPFLQQLGANRAIDYQKERFENIVKDVDVIIDLVGGETQKHSFDVLKRNGLLVTTVGLIDSNLPQQLGLKTVEFFMEKNGADLEELVRLVEQGIVKVRVGQVIPLEQAKKAQQINERGKSRGKIILKVA